MSAIAQLFKISAIEHSIHNHPAWLGKVAGLQAEKLMRGRRPYLYVLRAGEAGETDNLNYYVTFVHADGSVRHQPFVITFAEKGWCYENQAPGGPYTDATTISDVIHSIMHCDANQCSPFIS